MVMWPILPEPNLRILFLKFGYFWPFIKVLVVWQNYDWALYSGLWYGQRLVFDANLLYQVANFLLCCFRHVQITVQFESWFFRQRHDIVCSMMYQFLTSYRQFPWYILFPLVRIFPRQDRFGHTLWHELFVGVLGLCTALAYNLSCFTSEFLILYHLYCLLLTLDFRIKVLHVY